MTMSTELEKPRLPVWFGSNTKPSLLPSLWRGEILTISTQRIAAFYAHCRNRALDVKQTHGRAFSLLLHKWHAAL